ncbi:theg spermatid protein [Thalassophryne amazonica]|uniref:theg spermatid protein n=1 Tax=Thalassophryne amazonica TaxID=390379 RepID=UPI001471698B|nr:theg spermatid protein [Thalassophryne amazonica]
METRMQQLARPKPNHLRYPDRRSVYWLDKLPQEKTSSGTKIDLTPRWSELCRSKTSHTQDIVSPIWEVSKWALRTVPSERLCRLARPRPPAVGWQPDRLLLTPLSRATQTAIATSRICQLAQPKRKEDPDGSTQYGQAASMYRTPRRASAHTLLANPKHVHPQYVSERSVCWPVSRAARAAVPSERLLELSSPKERKALFEGYDPYVVSRAARSARASARIQQLSQPLPRKCSAGNATKISSSDVW